MSDKRHPNEDGHWGIEHIRKLLNERDALLAALREILSAEQDCNEPCYQHFWPLLTANDRGGVE